MKVVRPSYSVEFFVPESGIGIQKLIEKAARTCYQSEEKISEGSDDRLIRKLVKRGHYAMLEFGYAVAFITADRGFTHEMVRHRLASFAQESTRYCNYSKGKFSHEITVLEQPGFVDERCAYKWREAILYSERMYMDMVGIGEKAEIARSVLPIALKAKIVVGANLREWRHIFSMRCDPHAHPTMRKIMVPIFMDFLSNMPAIYEDLAEEFLS
jgi:thymidylate synthase (FAD)